MPRKKSKEIRLPKIEQLPSGAYHTRVLIDGQRVSITKDTPEECVAEYMALKHGVVEAKQKEKRKEKTLSEAVDEYIKSREGKRSPSTIAGYKKDKRNTFRSMMQANVYTTTDEQWQAAINQEHKLGRSSKYIQNSWALMGAAIEAATGRRPKVMLYPKERNERAYLDPKQIDTFVAAIKEKPVEVPALLCLSSLRRSEMLALRWDKIDFEKKVIYVHGAKVRGENGLVEKKQNKTDKSRRAVPMIPPLEEALRRTERKSDHVVTMGGDTILKQVKAVCAESGLPQVNLHGLRHSFASLAYHLGIPEMIAAEIGGWNDLGTMHRIYTHLAESDIAERAQDFRDFFSPEKRKEKVQIGNKNGNEK